MRCPHSREIYCPECAAKKASKPAPAWPPLGQTNPPRSWIQTYTGKAIDLLEPRVEDVDILDIAHALAHLCRYTGHVTGFYSVAEHCVHMSHIASPQNAFAALMHDATEAYVGDMSKPLKDLLPQYEAIEGRHWQAICWRFSLPFNLPDEVKHLDRAICMAEHKALMAPAPRPWGYSETPVYNFIPECWAPRVAEGNFLARFKSLYRGVK